MKYSSDDADEDEATKIPPQEVNIYCRAPGCDELCYPGDQYCSSLCRTIAQGFPAPAPVPVGLIGARTERPGADGDAMPHVLQPCHVPVLPTDSEARKQIPLFSGVMNYFPLALAAVARVSQRGNDKHNLGQPLHWARGKSMDHMDCIARHALDNETLDPITGEYEDAQCLAWRALANLQELEEKRLGKPHSRGSRSGK